MIPTGTRAASYGGMKRVSYTNLKRRGSVYYARRRIPVDLIPHYGKAELAISLHTKDLTVARTKLAEQMSAWDRSI